MPFEKGHKLSKGRPKGEPNKLTASAREAWQATFDSLQKGNNTNLLKWAEGNLTDFYKLYANKLIPIDANIDSVVTIVIEDETE